MTEPKFVDLAARKTEAGWQVAIDRFVLATTPELFKWVGWVAALTGLKFVADKTGVHRILARDAGARCTLKGAALTPMFGRKGRR